MMPVKGPPVEIGEPQWAVLYAGSWAHFVRLENSVILTACRGIARDNSVHYHPGSYPLCLRCARLHHPPHMLLGRSIIEWMALPAGRGVDRLRIDRAGD